MDAKDLQELLFQLFQQYLINIEGVEIQVSSDVPEVFISKSDLLDKLILVLNKFGEVVEGAENEINTRKSVSLFEETENSQ